MRALLAKPELRLADVTRIVVRTTEPPATAVVTDGRAGLTITREGAAPFELTAAALDGLIGADATGGRRTRAATPIAAVLAAAGVDLKGRAVLVRVAGDPTAAPLRLDGAALASAQLRYNSKAVLVLTEGGETVARGVSGLEVVVAK